MEKDVEVSQYAGEPVHHYGKCCSCALCHNESDRLRVFKHKLVCESCLDFIRKMH